MGKVRLTEDAKQAALHQIDTDILYELHCSNCGRFYGYYNVDPEGAGILLYCSKCKSFTVRVGFALDNK